MLMYLCRVYFLTALDIYKTYFKGCHIKEFKSSIEAMQICPRNKWSSVDFLKFDNFSTPGYLLSSSAFSYRNLNTFR